MNKVAILKKTSDKHICETEICINELDFKASCILIPFRRKLKRRDEHKLYKYISAYEHVFTAEKEFLNYERGVSQEKWLGFFLIEAINFITRGSFNDKVVVESNSLTELLMNTITELSKKYRVVELYTEDVELAKEFSQKIYENFGVPVLVSGISGECGTHSSFVIKVNDSISVYNNENDTEYFDVEISIMHPLSRYNDIPLEKILKSGLQQGVFKDVLKKGMVKIVGEISK